MKYFLRFLFCLIPLLQMKSKCQTEALHQGERFTKSSYHSSELEALYGIKLFQSINQPCTAVDRLVAPSTAGCFSESEPINAKKQFGATGDGHTDDYLAIIHTLERAVAAGACAYFPHGTYVFSQPITFVNKQVFSGICIEGEDSTATTLRYTGTTAASAAVLLSGPAPEIAWFGGSMKRMTVIGNAQTAASVEIDTSAHFRFEDMETVGATAYGLKVYEGVHFSAIHAKVDQFTQDRYAGVELPTNGLLFTGNSKVDYASAPSLIAQPVIEGLRGRGIDIEVAGLVTITGCQCSGNGQNLFVSNLAANQVGQVTITGNLFENERTASYIGGIGSVVTSNVFSNIQNPATGVQIDGKGLRFIGNQVGTGPLHVMPTAEFAVLENNLLNTVLITGIPTYGIYDEGIGTEKSGNAYSDLAPGENFTQSERSPASKPTEMLGLDAQKITSGTWEIGIPSAPGYLSYVPVTLGKSWEWICYGCKLGSSFGGGGTSFPPIMELTETHNTFVDPVGGQTVTIMVNPTTGILQITHPAGDGGGEYLTGTFVFVPDKTAKVSGPYSAHLQGIIEDGGQLGAETAPAGRCAINGVWVFSQDGHATYCNAGTWKTKI